MKPGFSAFHFCVYGYVFNKMKWTGFTSHLLPLLIVHYWKLSILWQKNRLYHRNTVQLFFFCLFFVTFMNEILLEKCWFLKTKFGGKGHTYFTYIYFNIFNICIYVVYTRVYRYECFTYIHIWFQPFLMYFLLKATWTAHKHPL